MSTPKHHHGRALLWALGVLLAILAAVRTAANPLARHFTRQAIARISGFHGELGDVKVSFLHLRYRIEHLKLVADTHGPGESPVREVYVGSAEGSLAWRDLLRFKLSARARIADAKITIAVREASHAPSGKKRPSPAKPPPQLAGKLHELFPFQVDAVTLHNGQVLVIDETTAGVPGKSRELWIHDIDATIDNIATRRSLMKGAPTTMAIEAKVQRSGTLTAYVTADPLSRPLSFSVRSSLRGLRLQELWGFVGKENMKPVQGTLDASTVLACERGRIHGTVTPVLKNAKVAPADRKLTDIFKSTLTDEALSLRSRPVPGGRASSTVIPIEGTVTNPKAELLPTVVSTLRNAYVTAISGVLSHAPPRVGLRSQKSGPLSVLPPHFVRHADGRRLA